MLSNVIRLRCRISHRKRPVSQGRISIRCRRLIARRTQPLRPLRAKKTNAEAPLPTVREEDAFQGLTPILDNIKWSKNQNLVPVIVQHIDTGEILMQAYADRSAVSETMQTKLATFYSRSREERWCKGETSGNFIQVDSIYVDCDSDSIVYMGYPIGPSCHTGARTCWFHEIKVAEKENKAEEYKDTAKQRHSPMTTLFQLETTIQQRKDQADDGVEKSWTVKLLNDPDLLCSKIVEEATELCQSTTNSEGMERTAEEMADVLYHSMVLLSRQGVSLEDVMKVLRRRFGTSGIKEKESRSNIQ